MALAQALELDAFLHTVSVGVEEDHPHRHVGTPIIVCGQVLGVREDEPCHLQGHLLWLWLEGSHPCSVSEGLEDAFLRPSELPRL